MIIIENYINEKYGFLEFDLHCQTEFLDTYTIYDMIYSFTIFDDITKNVYEKQDGDSLYMCHLLDMDRKNLEPQQIKLDDNIILVRIPFYVSFDNKCIMRIHIKENKNMKNPMLSFTYSQGIDHNINRVEKKTLTQKKKVDDFSKNIRIDLNIFRDHPVYQLLFWVQKENNIENKENVHHIALYQKHHTIETFPIESKHHNSYIFYRRSPFFEKIKKKNLDIHIMSFPQTMSLSYENNSFVDIHVKEKGNYTVTVMALQTSSCFHKNVNIQYVNPIPINEEKYSIKQIPLTEREEEKEEENEDWDDIISNIVLFLFMVAIAYLFLKCFENIIYF